MDAKEKNSKTITIKELWDIFCQRWWIILIATVIITGSLFVIDRVTFVPQYESVSTLYVMRENDDDTAAEKIQEYNLALWVIKDYDYMLKSRKVLGEVSKELEKEGIYTSYGKLKSSITVNNPEETRILEIRVVSGDPVHAKRIVDVLCKIGVEEIGGVMDSENQITVFENGTYNENPCNRKSFTTFIILAFIIAIATYLIFMAAYLFDDRIKSNEDIEDFLSLSILGDIPEISEHGDKHHGYSKKKNNYYAYSNKQNSQNGGEDK